MKLISDLVGVVPPLGLAVVIQYLQDPHQVFDTKQVTIEEFCSNGYVMLLLITLALIIQAFLSQNSTHLVTVEGTRLKTALQVRVNSKNRLLNISTHLLGITGLKKLVVYIVFSLYL